MYFGKKKNLKMNVLLLGGFGFIGTNILKYVDRYFPGKYSFYVFDRYFEHPDGITFECIENVYSGDFKDAMIIRSVLQSHSFDFVIHSLSSTVPTTSINVRFDIESNLIPTIELLDIILENNVKNIIFISSGGAIYGKSENKHKESDNNFPLSSYGIVKLAIEKYLFQYASLYQLNPLILRLSNPYGPYHYSNKQGISNVALRAAHNQIEFNVWGNGEAKKDYIYIDDFCNILFRLIDKRVTNKILNVASEQVLSLNEILAEIKTIYPSFLWKYSEASILDIDHFELDISELRTIVDTFNFTSFSKGIKLTKHWLELQKIDKTLC